jgi:hypothetical protein
VCVLRISLLCFGYVVYCRSLYVERLVDNFSDQNHEITSEPVWVIVMSEVNSFRVWSAIFYKRCDRNEDQVV